MLTALLGVARAGQRKSHELVFPFFQALLTPLTQLVGLYGGRNDSPALNVVHLVLQIFAALAEVQLSYLSASHSQHFMSSALALVRVYAETNQNRLRSFLEEKQPQQSSDPQQGGLQNSAG